MIIDTTLSVFGEERLIDALDRVYSLRSFVTASLIIKEYVDCAVDALVRGFFLQNAAMSAGKDVFGVVGRYYGSEAHRVFTAFDLTRSLVQNNIRPGATLVVSVNEQCQFTKYTRMDRSLRLTLFIQDGTQRRRIRVHPLNTLGDVLRCIKHIPNLRTPEPRRLYFGKVWLDDKKDVSKPIIDWGVVDGSVLRLEP